MKNDNNLLADFGTFTTCEKEKAIALLSVASKLGMDLSSYGHLGLNASSGNVYLCFEDYDFCLYVPINWTGKKSDIWVSWYNPENWEEIDTRLGSKKLVTLEQWAQNLYKKHCKDI